MTALVVDSGRLHFLIGNAGDDSPTSFTPQSGEAVYPTHDDSKALQQRWEANVSIFAEHTRQAIDRQEQTDEEFNSCALFTCSVCDDSESKHVRDVLSTVLAPDSGVSYLDIVPQEILIMYANGRTTGLVVNLGLDVTVMGMYEGHVLGETVRRAPMVASEDAFLADAAKWEQRMQLAALVSEALEAAPVDVRCDLATNILVGGGRWGGWPGLKEHLKAHLEELWAARRPAVKAKVKVVMPPEAALSSWIGGSILASLGNYQNSQMRNRGQWLASEPSTRPKRWKPPMLSMPPDREMDYDVRKVRARVLVHAAPSLCAKLPEELQDAIAERVAHLGYPHMPAVRTTACIPPPLLEPTRSLLSSHPLCACTALLSPPTLSRSALSATMLVRFHA
uniref:Actin-related protein 8 n=1 Tax=Haptolina brevifila TaxID=156173 RepID=A0A7S2E3G8_9EUKA|mmetsp:Transcript_47453/g.94735  ORF Transcript_47453/g.94735 Transcript_47453/m.94735 type:complete len:393 (+) Transcript_47453:178-1356(+)